MKNKQPTSPTRVRLYSHVTKTRFLHIEDALNIGKVRLFAGTYSRGQGMSGHTSHYLDVSDARIVFHALLHGEPGFNYKEYKGIPPSVKQPAVSRVLSVVVKGDNVYIELKSGPGRLTPTGAITPNGRAETEVNVSFRLHEARRLAGESLSYIHAWDVYRMMAFQEVVGKPPVYRLSPPAGTPDASAPLPLITNDAGRPVATSQPAAVATSGVTRPVTGKGSPPKGNWAEVNAVNRPAVLVAKQVEPTVVTMAIAEAVYGPEGVLRYGDGLAVDAHNTTEAQAFRRYVTETEELPATKAVLQAYYRQHMVI